MGLLDDLQNVLEATGTTKILSSLKNDKLNFPSVNDIRVMIPDMQDTLSSDHAAPEQGTIGALCGNEARIFHVTSN